MKKKIISLLALSLIVSSVVALFSQQLAHAQSFDAGRIMDDGVFTNHSSMNVGQIQNFLNSKVPQCDTNGDKPSEYGGGTRRQYAASRNVSPPFTCLKDYHQNGKSAAQIIYDAAQEFRINPQVLIVLLQKEQGLVTDDWPWPIQYRAATGYGCPDTAPCDSEYYGLTNQLRWAARMFRAIMNDSPTWYTPYVLGNNQIPWHPDAGRCGYSTVNIQNRATKALYNYTPYRPNQAALNAGYGMGDGCSSYGNRNFYLYFTDWFGSTHANVRFTLMNDPRWMQIARNVRKVDPQTNRQVGETLTAGTQIKFSSKVRLGAEDCLRTKYDTIHNLRRCVPISDISEINLNIATIAPTTMRVTANTNKYDIRRDRVVKGSKPIENTQQLTFTGRVTLGPNTFYLSQHDMNRGFAHGVLASRLSDQTINYESIQPRLKELTRNTRKTIPIEQRNINETHSAGMQRYYVSRGLHNGVWYYRTEQDTKNNLDKAIPESALRDVAYESFQTPRWMEVSENIQKFGPLTRAQITETLGKGTQLRFSSKVQVNGKWYYRTASDTSNNLDKAVEASRVKEISYESFLSPRELRVSANTTKFIPSTQQTGDQLPQGMTRKFNSKIRINSTWYYRTEYDTQHSINQAVRAADLEEL